MKNSVLPTIETAGSAIRRHFVWFLCLAYLFAALVPLPGEWLRIASFEAPLGLAKVAWVQVLFALLLFNAGLSLDLKATYVAYEQPFLLPVAVLTKLFIPAALVGGFALLPDTIGNVATGPLVAGLALVFVMPAAASVPVWTQAAGGNVALGLAMVVITTLLAPVWGPFMLDFVAGWSGVEETNRVRFDSVFFAIWVLVPALAGSGIRAMLSTRHISATRPFFRLVNSALLLVLIYSFAAASLGRVFRENLTGELLLAGGMSVSACALSFLAGGVLVRVFRVAPPQRPALVFGVGMFNNGIALLVGAAVLPPESPVFLPIIGYALVQHLAAGIINAQRQLPEAA